MNIFRLFAFCVAFWALSGCQDNPAEATAVLADPSELKVEQLDLETVRFTWKDNAKGEVGYAVYLRKEGEAYYIDPVGTVAPDVTGYTFGGLKAGELYDFGIQAVSDDFKTYSQTMWIVDYIMLDREGLAGLDGGNKLPEPTELAAVQSDKTSVTLSWKDNATGESGYNIYYRKAGDASFGSVKAALDADASSYTVAGLSEGSYEFGVQAASEVLVNSSKIAVCALEVKDFDKIPEVVSLKTSYAFVAVTYKVAKISGTNPEHGVCFSAAGAPSVEDIRCEGAGIAADQAVMQAVPNAVLEADKEYKMSVYVKNGDEYIYSEPMTVKLEPQPEAMQLSWTDATPSGLHPDIKIFKTESPLSGRAFNAWYAVADVTSGGVEFKAMNLDKGVNKLLSVQAEENKGCEVLVNGGIFGWNYTLGVVIEEGKLRDGAWIEELGLTWCEGPDGKSYGQNITRATIGVDAAGVPGAYWSSSPASSTIYHYDRPLPALAGEIKQPQASATYPCTPASWSPYYAISCGPMLVYDGKIMVTMETTDYTPTLQDEDKVLPEHFYYGNWECWKYNVYATRRARTAVGIMEDGKMVLFVCDEDSSLSKGATLVEVAQIMKGLGCKYAMNLDGGGSTGMWAAGDMVNAQSQPTRKVKSTLGFFSK